MNLNIFKNEIGDVFAYDDEQVEQGYANDKIAMTPAEVEAHLNPPKSLPDLKSEKLKLINDAADSSLSTILSTYPGYEVVSWDKQENEARTYLLDDTAPVPLLLGIATARGIPLSVLVDKVIEKADAFATLSGAIFGKRQALEAAVNAATTVAEVDAVEVVF